MSNRWTLVNTASNRETARRDLLAARRIGLDTEYDSFRYFREKLCLIQISTEDNTYLFDPLLDIDFSFLGEVSANPATVKIIHACDNDIRLLNRDYGFRFTNVFDTYRAAGILGDTGLSLKALIQDYLGVELQKTKKIQRSRWDVRPLTDEQLDYAALDTRYLIDLYWRLKERLELNNLENAAQEIFDKMAAVRWQEKCFNQKGFFTIVGYDDLEECQKLRLQKLYHWRFETARRTNRAPFLILSDKAIVDLSREKADSVGSLGDTGILSPETVQTFGAEIVKMMR
jgi:ribonuclease D